MLFLYSFHSFYKKYVTSHIINISVMLNRHHLSVLIPEQAKKYGDRTAMTYRCYEQNRWLPISWNQFSAKGR